MSTWASATASFSAADSFIERPSLRRLSGSITLGRHNSGTVNPYIAEPRLGDCDAPSGDFQSEVER
jgi:hypothetical protein